MSSSIINPHKKGEHVFNDIGGSVENAFQASINSNELNALVLTGPHGLLKLTELRRTSEGIGRFQRDRILAEARTIVAPATGIANDANSKSYSAAKVGLERALSAGALCTAAYVWRKKPRSASSFGDFELTVKDLREARASVEPAKAAFDKLIDSAVDPAAESSALLDKVSDSELRKRRAVIDAMKQHRPILKQMGSGLIAAFFEELEEALERRIDPS